MNKTLTSLPGAKTVGNYVIGKNLGEGTFGKVKMGIHTHTQQKVAIKILEKSKICDVADVQRVTREINILKQVRHPNLIQLYEIIETPKQLFLVMQYVSEGELFEHIVKKKRLKQSEACQFFQQIIAGVEYLHQLGVVHRDLKPENLLIDFNRRLKLVDFGLSNTYRHSEVLKTACGSPCYAAPEMIAGKRYEGLNADLWSCGVILYAMVCGYLPFEDPNTTALYKKIIAGDFSIPKFVSPSAKNLIQGILTTDPAKRYTLKTIKNHEWFKHPQKSEFYLEKIPYGIKVAEELIPLDEGILEQMKQFDETPVEELKKYIANNRHNHSISIYYLLMKKNLRLGKHSAADICSQAFNTSLVIRKAIPEKTKETTAPASDDVKSVESRSNDRTTTTAARNRSIPTRAGHNRVSIIRDPRNRNNFFQKKKEDESVDFKLDLDNLPSVDATINTSHRRRKLVIPSKNLKQKEPTTNFYDVEEVFRTANYPTTYRVSRPSVPGNRAPISFRNTIDRYQKTRQNDRYSFMESTEQKPTSAAKDAKNLMNKTFMGRIPKNTFPKWQDENEKIRSILHNTITGHGSRKKKNKYMAFF